MTENRPFSRKITTFGNFSPLGANQDITIFQKLFDFFKAHNKRQLYWNRHIKTPILRFSHHPNTQSLEQWCTTSGPQATSGPRRVLMWPATPSNKINYFRAVFICYSLFIHSRIYKAPLQEIYSEAPQAQPRRYRSVLSNLQNELSLFLGRIWISKGSPFQVEGPTMVNARRCLVAVLARGTNSWPVAEERRALRPGRPFKPHTISLTYTIIMSHTL